jgi:hypothetical protein
MRTPAHARIISAEKPLVIHDVCLNPGHVCVSIKPDFFWKGNHQENEKTFLAAGEQVFLLRP